MTDEETDIPSALSHYKRGLLDLKAALAMQPEFTPQEW